MCRPHEPVCFHSGASIVRGCRTDSKKRPMTTELTALSYGVTFPGEQAVIRSSMIMAGMGPFSHMLTGSPPSAPQTPSSRRCYRGARTAPVVRHDGAAVHHNPSRAEDPGASSPHDPVRPECPDASSGCIEGPAQPQSLGGADASIDGKAACAPRYAPLKQRRYSG